jgi:predicted PurR-regulated permease PerM
MSAVITSVVTLLTTLLPLVTGNSSAIATVIATLIQLIPAITQEVEAMIPPIKNIIAALSADPATTADQLATLQKLDADCDAAFEAAAVDPTADAAQ